MQMDGTYVGAVVLSGISIVFLSLVLLIFFVWLMDKIFKAVKESKTKPAPAVETKAPPKLPPSPPPVASAPAPAPKIEDGIGDETVAVIAAAIAAISAETGKTLRIRSVKRGAADRRGAWGSASAAENTRLF